MELVDDDNWNQAAEVFHLSLLIRWFQVYYKCHQVSTPACNLDDWRQKRSWHYSWVRRCKGVFACRRDIKSAIDFCRAARLARQNSSCEISVLWKTKRWRTERYVKGHRPATCTRRLLPEDDLFVPRLIERKVHHLYILLRWLLFPWNYSVSSFV